MKFLLVDKILEVVPGKRIKAVKTLSNAEEYLADHFPGRPVMPGVLMLETMVQAGAWLERVTSGFAHSMVLLREVRNVKYGQFVTPGECLQVDVRILRTVDGGLLCEGRGAVAERPTVSGRFELRAFNLADERPALAQVDRRIKEHLKRMGEVLLPRLATAAQAGRVQAPRNVT